MKIIRFNRLLTLLISVCLLATMLTSIAYAEEGTFSKFDPPITISAWRYIQTNVKYAEGDSIENNIYMTAYADQLGINVDYMWAVPQEQFEQKMNISIASGDLADIMWLNQKQVIELSEYGQLYDLTDLYDEYASDLVKEIMAKDEATFNTAVIDGRLMAIPHMATAVDSLPMVHIRKDWLDKLGLEIPQTMDELFAVAEAFTTQDPNGSGKDDTYGMTMTKNFMTELYGGIAGFFAGYHAYPTFWFENENGQLVYGGVQPEIKNALLALQNLYANGWLDQEFGVKDRNKMNEGIGAGYTGIVFGAMGAPIANLQSSASNDPEADWISIPLVSADDTIATPMTQIAVNRYYAVSTNSQYPEAIIQLLNFGVEKNYGKTADTEYGTNSAGIGAYLYSLVGTEKVNKNLDAHLHIMAAFESGDASALNAEETGYYNNILGYREGNRSLWMFERVFGTPSTFDVVNTYVTEGNLAYNGFYGAPTETMVEKQSTLDKLQEEVFTKIILGQSIDTFDEFVENWYKLGGTEITEEVNAWAAGN